MGEWFQIDELLVLFYGDLWGGNVMVDVLGGVVIYDLVVYYGCREVDMVMIELFGGFDSAFYVVYNEVYLFLLGYLECWDFYNFYYVFNYVNFFGGGYAS